MKKLLVLFIILLNGLFASNLHFDKNRFFGFNKTNAIYSNNNKITFTYLKDFKLTENNSAFYNIESKYFNYKSLELEFIGANFSNISGDSLNEYNNFYFGNDDNNRYNCNKYIIIYNIYNNINLIIRDNNNNYEYLFELNEGANISDIKIKPNISGHIANGEIILDDFFITKSKAFFEDKQSNQFELEYNISNNVISYKNNINIKSKLYIDPIVLLQATMYGGKAVDRFYDMDVNKNKDVYSAGLTSSTAMIAYKGYQDSLAGNYDAFIVKFDSLGNRKWATYFGGKSDDIAFSTKVKNDNITFAGRTSSDDLFISNDAHQKKYGGGDSDAFLVELDSTGELVYSSYFGGEGNDAINGIDCLDNSIFIAGYTNSENGISSGGYQNTKASSYDGFIAKFDFGDLDWATYFGGDGDDFINNLTFKNNNILIIGSTNSANNIAYSGFQDKLRGDYDSFYSQFKLNGKLSLSSYFGGSKQDFGYAIDSDSDNNIYLLGSSYSMDLPTNINQFNLAGNNDIFIAKLNNDKLLYCTYFGGEDNESAYDLKYNNNLYVVGSTKSISGIAYNSEYNKLNGKYDGFILKTDKKLNPIISAYLGGSEDDVARSVYADNNIIIAGYTASSNTFYKDGFQKNNNGETDGFITIFQDNSKRNINNINIDNICSGDSLNLILNIDYALNKDNYYNVYLSDTDGDFTNNILIASIKSIDSIINFKIPDVTTYSNKYRIKIETTNPEAFAISNTFTIYPDINININKTKYCKNDILKANIVNYPTSNSKWYINGELISESDSISLNLNKYEIGSNTLLIKQTNELCENSKTINIIIKDEPIVDIVGNINVCVGNIETYYYNSNYPADYTWKIVGGIVSSQNSNSITIEWNNINSYINIKSKETDSTCAVDNTKKINSYKLEKAEIIGASNSCINCIEEYYIKNSYAEYKWEVDGGELLSADTLNKIIVKWIDKNASISLKYINNNCKDIVNKNIIISEDLELSISPNVNTVCYLDTMMFTTSQNEKYKYTWESTNAEILENNEYNISLFINKLDDVKIILIRENKLNSELDTLVKNINVIKIDDEISGIKDTFCLDDIIKLNALSEYDIEIETDLVNIIYNDNNTIEFEYLDSGLKNIKIIISNEYCQKIIDTNIFIAPNPEAPTIYIQGNEIYSNSEYNIWYENDKIIENNNSNKIKAKNNNKYYAKSINNYDCTSSDTSNIINYNINNVEDEIINIYPNPSNGNINIRLSKKYYDTNIEIYDLLGNIVFNKRYNSQEIGLETKLKSGLYFIKIHYDNNIIIRKINIIE